MDEKKDTDKCAKCGMEFYDNYQACIPGIGWLCKRCAKEWKQQQRKKLDWRSNYKNPLTGVGE